MRFLMREATCIQTIPLRQRVFCLAGCLIAMLVAASCNEERKPLPRLAFTQEGVLTLPDSFNLSGAAMSGDGDIVAWSRGDTRIASNGGESPRDSGGAGSRY